MIAGTRTTDARYTCIDNTCVMGNWIGGVRVGCACTRVIYDKSTFVTVDELRAVAGSR